MTNPNGKYPSQKKTRNRAKGTAWAHALRKSLKQYDTEDPKYPDAIRKIADNVVECALDPTNEHFEFAIKEIGARIDGSPKNGELPGGVNATEFLLGISDAVTALNDFRSESQIVHGETIVQDRPLLSAEVCAETGGHGERVDIQSVPGGSEEP